MAEANAEKYIKDKNEDFITLLSGIIGQKKRIHIHVGEVLTNEIDTIASEFDNNNKQIQALAQVIDDAILQTYKLWPTNYIAYDLLFKTDQFKAFYTENEKSLFERRLEMRIDETNPQMVEGFLAMYANPVVNKMKYEKPLFEAKEEMKNLLIAACGNDRRVLDDIVDLLTEEQMKKCFEKLTKVYGYTGSYGQMVNR